MTTCKYCENENGCDAEQGFICTREKGHEGSHVACGTAQFTHEVYRWDDAPPEVPTLEADNEKT